MDASLNEWPSTPVAQLPPPVDPSMAPQPVKVFVTVRYYLPGYKTGGPARSIANIIERLGDRFQFYVVTQDRDWLDTEPYRNVARDVWTVLGKGRVFYASKLSSSLLRRLIVEVHPDWLYLNSFFFSSDSARAALAALRAVRPIAGCPGS